MAADLAVGGPRSLLVERVHASAASALAHLGMTPVSGFVSLPTMPDRPHRQVVRCATTSSEGRDDVAVRVVLDPQVPTANAFSWEHTLGVELGAIADALLRAGAIPRNPVVRVLHAEPVTVEGALVSVNRFVASCGTPVTARAWGETLGLLHRIGSTQAALSLLRRHRATNWFLGLDAEMFLCNLRRPGHPFGHDRDLALRFVRVLTERARRAQELDPQPLLIHADLHALNCVNTSTGVVAIDWQEAGWGNRSRDFAWLYLAVSRFGRPAAILETAKAAYASSGAGTCPTNAQIRACGQLLELVCLGFSLQHADRSLEHLRECQIELPILRDAQARTGRWRMLHNPSIFTPGVAA